MNNDNIKVSVIIPIYNVEDYLEECLDSVLNQTLDGIEVIMVDDDSPDGSAVIAKRYADEHDNFFYYWQENGRQGKARNNGVKHARGEYLFFLDSDDILPRDALAKMYAVGHDRDKDIVTSNVVRFDEDGETKSRLHEIAFRSFGVDTDVYSNNSLLFDHTAANKLIRREFWEKVGFPFPENMFYEDIPTMNIMYCSTRKVGLIHDVCYQWRIRGGEKQSVTQSRTNYSNLKDRLKAMKIVDDYFDANIYDQNLKEAKEYKWAYTDLKIFINQCVNMEREDFANHLALIQEYVKENISEKTIARMPVIHKEMYRAVLAGDIDRLCKLRELDVNDNYNRVRITEEDGRILGHFSNDVIPDAVDMETTIRTRAVRQRVQDIEFNGERLKIYGFILVVGLPTTDEEPECIQAYLYREETDERIPVDTRTVKSELAQEKYGISKEGEYLNNYIQSGYEITVDLERDIIGNGLTGDYKILIECDNRGFHHQALLGKGTKPFKENIKYLYGSHKDKTVRFRFESGDYVVLNVGEKQEREPSLAMHSFLTKLSNESGRFDISGLCFYRFRDEKGRKLQEKGVRAFIGSNGRDVSFRISKKGLSLPKGIRFGRYRISFPEQKLTELDIQNKIQLRCGDTVARIGYSVLDRSKGRYKTSRIINKGGLACYLKQSIYNGMYLTVREPQIYDEPAGRFRAWAAWLLAKFWPKNNLIYLFEKECSKYEESASVLYEKLIDAGYDNVCYIVNEGNPAIQNLDEKYRKNLIYKDTFGHLLRFFKSKVFISSETMAHAMQLRASDKRIAQKTDSENISYVFLQHGVMYMVSLNADLRVSFREKDIDLYRVVVSSQLEADHFIELAGFQPEELYITGLATFDKSVKDDDADRIVIMPTWRRWETNQARENFIETKYFRMIERMFNAVPEGLKDKVIILPHPLMQDAMNKTENSLSGYLASESHNDTLKRCSLLITDYSSIAYDAYYRGSNVVFYWEEKDECMRNYGAETKLMIDEESAFGDVCYNEEQLSASIERWYNRPQEENYLDRYRKIVTFHDGNNTKRIMDHLKKDGIL